MLIWKKKIIGLKIPVILFIFMYRGVLILKKLLNSFLIIGLLLSLVSPLSVFASDLTSENTMEKDYKELMGLIKEKVLDGWSEDQIGELPEVIEFQSKYTEDEVYQYLNTKVSAFNYNLVEDELENLDLGLNDREIVEFDDGSFVVAETATVSEDNSNSVSTFASHSGKPGSKWKTSYKVDFWGVYLAARAKINTSYTVNKGSIKITDVTKAGTKANAPTTIVVDSLKKVINNKKTVKSRGSFTKVNGIVIGGQPIGFSDSFDLTTTLKITSATNSKVKWTSSSKSSK